MDHAQIWKICLITGIILLLVAFILGWIGFGVPDWQSFQLYTGSVVEYYGLWAYCQEQTVTYGTVCNRWYRAETQLFNGTRPTFISTSEGLITVGMILLSLGLVVAILATILPLLGYVASLMALISFVFLVIGLPIFGQDSNNLSRARGDVTYNKRYGFWLMVPTIVLEFLAMLLFLAAAFLYQRYGYGNIFTDSDTGVKSGWQVLGQPNMLVGPPPRGLPYGMGLPPMNLPHGMGLPPMNLPHGMRLPAPFNHDGFPPAPYPYSAPHNQVVPSLLSQYCNSQLSRPLGPLLARSITVSTLPQPCVTRAIASQPIPNVLPDYCRTCEPVEPPCRSIINCTGRTLVGPLMRTC
ncbi:unnamed protein product [Rotaria sordida]|uniref:Uncharacterized protein n=1 Tax=Rotaria sordida TaxID=392033 RepID=A0A814JLI7_9BILA|nr:unnamed protein product [Rotaria sordida]CAF1076912.1 unnamed protein product [Rotaria sordida]CAF3861818.1 unnamed protein product [Rotaria sordida]